MGRYDQKISKKYSSQVLMIVLFVIATIVVIRLFQIDNQGSNTVNKEIEVPTQKSVPVLDADIQNIEDTSESDLSVDKQSDVSASNEEIVKKFVLMELEESDDSFREGMKKVSEKLTHWLEYKNIIKKLIIMINDLSQNQIIFKHRKFLKLPQKMLVADDAQGLYISKKSYARFDLLTNAISTINVQESLDLYLTYKPLLKQVFDEFGYPAEYQLEDIFLKAAASVIDAPITEGKIYLVQDSVRYKFADKKIEALSDVKKQMLRMGPENTRKIQDKLRELVEALILVS